MPNSITDLARKIKRDLFGHPSGPKPLIDLPREVHNALLGKPKKNR